MTLLSSLFSTAQNFTFKEEFLMKWKSTTEYTLKVAQKMPESKYNYKPNPDMRSFGEQMEHIGYAITYLPHKALNIKEVKYKGSLTDKIALVNYLKSQFAIIENAVEQTEDSAFEKPASFWAGKMTLRKILNITYDHTTHNRAQAIIYLRINKLKAPQYIAW